MRKIYSLVLMATMLLIGTNAWADGVIEIVRGDATLPTTYDNLKDAFVAAQDGDILQLTGDINESPSEAAWFGAPSSGTPETYANPDPENPQNGYRAVTLDLKGHTYTFSGNPRESSVFVCIAFTRGKLTIKSTGGKGEIKSTTNNVELIRVYGTYHKIDAKEETPFTHLVVEENVKLTSDQLNAITIEVPQKEQATSQWNRNYPLDYSCHFSPIAQQGVSNGVRLDIKGELTGKKYGLKPSGNIRIGREFYEKDEVNGGYKLWDEGKVFKSGEYAYVFTMVYDEKNTTTHECYKPGTTRTNQVNYVNAHSLVKPEGATKGWAYSYVNTYEEGGGYEWGYNDSIYSPYIHIYPSARLVANNPGSGKAAGFYSAGYARCLIEGYCEGSTGVYVKSGDVELHDATVKSNWESDYKAAQPGTPAAAIDAGGSAIVIDSNEGWTGSISVTIGGDTKVTTEHGYAIDERITNNDGTNVDYLTITGGTFQGGEIGKTGDVPIYGSVYISQPTLDANSSETEITTINVLGANITSTDNKIGDGENQTTLADFLSGQGNNTHITYVEVPDPNNPSVTKTTMVISEGDAPATYEDPENPEAKTPWSWCAHNDQSGKNVAWTEIEDAEIASGTITLGELQIISGTGTAAGERQQLTIKSGATLQVEHLIMNAYARIIVEAGGKLIVEGTQGIIAPKVENIKLESSETAQAYFIFHPNVNSNKYPNATVEFKSKAYLNGTKGVFQRFGVPTWNRETEKTTMTSTGAAKTWITQYDYTTDDWAAWTAYNYDTEIEISDARPFRGYMLYSNNDKDHKMDYSFKGNLIGNQNENLHMYYGWNYFANSYTAPISIKDFINTVMASLDADKKDYILGTIYLYQNSGDDDYTWTGISLVTPEETWEIINNVPTLVPNQLTIQPMQAFLMRLNLIDGQMDQTISYKYDVYNPNMNISNNNTYLAPARQQEANNAMHVLVSGEGSWDKVYVVENDNFSSDLDNGYDAYKFDGNTGVSLYAMSADARMDILATDDAEGTFIGIKTPKAGNYTLHVAGVKGMEYAIVDMENNTVFEAVDGAKYEFYANAGVNDYRFQVVAAAKMPTAIENTEDIKKVNGVYTITGQFLGNDLNALPAGVYIVNGVKVVK